MIIPKKDSKGRYYARFWRKDGSRPYKLLETEAGTLSYQEAKDAAVEFFNSFGPVPMAILLGTRPTISQCFGRFLEVSSRVTEENAAYYRTCLTEKFVPFFTDIPLEEVTLLKVEQYRAHRLKQRGYRGRNVQGGTINREVGTLLAVMSRCHQLGLIRVHPLSDKELRRLDYNQKTGIYFELDEYNRFIGFFSDRERVLAEADRCCRIKYSAPDRDAYVFNAKRMGDVFRVQLWTDSRISEILALRWTAVNFRTGIVAIFQPKVRNIAAHTKHQEMSPELRSLLGALHRDAKDKSGYIFTRRDGQPFTIAQAESFFAKGIKAAGIKKYNPQGDEESLTPHSLRHTACSWLVQDKVPLAEIQRIAGHSSIRSTMGYADLRTDNLTGALMGLAAKTEKVDSQKEIRDNGSDNESGLRGVK